MPLYTPPVDDGAPRAVLIVIDGARYTETLGDPERAHVPNLARLAQEGCAPGPILNQGTTITPFGLASLHTGIWDAWGKKASTGEGYFYRPTHWEYYRRQNDAPESDALWVLPGYNWSSIWKPSYDKNYGPSYWPTIVAEGDGDVEVTGAFARALLEHKPHFAVLYLADVDGAGHSGIWSTYIEAIETADRMVGEVWELLQSNEPYAGHTTLFVTSDHGRHDDAHGGFEGHGCSCDGCRQVTFLAIGPSISADCMPNRSWELVDIVPSLGRLLSFEPDQSDGEPMSGLYSGS